MTILDDLNAMTLGTTLATFAISVSFVAAAIHDRRMRRSARGVGRYLILLAGLCWCGILGLSTLDNVSDAAHSFLTGQLKVAEYQYGPRGTHLNLYRACAAKSKSSGVLLVMEPKAQAVLRSHQELPEFKIEYLTEYLSVGSNKMAYKVVDISDPYTGTSFYHLDTSHHPWRSGLLFSDAAWLLLTGLLDFCLFFTNARPQAGETGL
jgi:hypothetical protein